MLKLCGGLQGLKGPDFIRAASDSAFHHVKGRRQLQLCHCIKCVCVCTRLCPHREIRKVPRRKDEDEENPPCTTVCKNRIKVDGWGRGQGKVGAGQEVRCLLGVTVATGECTSGGVDGLADAVHDHPRSEMSAERKKERSRKRRKHEKKETFMFFGFFFVKPSNNETAKKTDQSNQ